MSSEAAISIRRARIGLPSASATRRSWMSGSRCLEPQPGRQSGSPVQSTWGAGVPSASEMRADRACHSTLTKPSMTGAVAPPASVQKTAGTLSKSQAREVRRAPSSRMGRVRPWRSCRISAPSRAWATIQTSACSPQVRWKASSRGATRLQVAQSSLAKQIRLGRPVGKLRDVPPRSWRVKAGGVSVMDPSSGSQGHQPAGRVAEVDGNRTHHTPVRRVTGFEDRGSHQTPVTSIARNTRAGSAAYRSAFFG